jgi:hypothetical protein
MERQGDGKGMKGVSKAGLQGYKAVKEDIEEGEAYSGSKSDATL